MTVMRVLFVAPSPGDRANCRYRCGHLAQALGSRGVAADFAWMGQNRARVAHDVVVLHRVLLDAMGNRYLRAARDCGAVVVYSADDLIFEPDYAYQAGMTQPNDRAWYSQHQQAAQASRAMAQAADALLVSTEFLASRSRRLTPKPVHVVRNFLSDEMLCLSDAAAERRLETSGRVVLGYLSGSPTHDADLADIAAPLARVLRRHENVNLLVVGVVRLPLELERFASRIQRHPFVGWRDLPGLLAGVDINLAPLDPTRLFNHAKSEVKFLEAAAVCVPTIASATAGFAEAVSHGEDGFLAHTREDWVRLLTQLVECPAERAAVGVRAHATLLGRATTGANASPLADLFSSLAMSGGARPNGSPKAVLVKRPFSLRVEAAARRTEEGLWRVWTRLARHGQLMAREQRQGKM